MRVTKKTVMNYMTQEIENVRLYKSAATIKHHVRAQNSFRKFIHHLHRNDLPLRQLSPELIAAYQRYLQVQGMCRNTTSYYLRNLRVLLSRAMRQGRVADGLFDQVYTGVDTTRKRAVKDDLIRRLAQLDIPAALASHGHNPRRKTFPQVVEGLDMARDLFLFSFYTCGMPFVDMAHLTQSNLSRGVIRYSRQKTRQQIEIGIQPEIQHLINKYRTPSRFLFPIFCDSKGLPIRRLYDSALRQYNRQLMELSQLLDISIPLSSYVSRHTWATSASRHCISLPVISQALGHNSEHTTRIYLQSLESNVIKEANRQLLDSIFVAYE